MASALEKLVVSETELSEDVLAGVLESLLRFTPDGMLVPQEAFDSLEANQKILAVLLGFHALKLLGKREQAAAGPKEISEASGVPEGTVKPAVRALEKDRLVRGVKGKYSVPPHAFQAVSRALGRGG